MILVYSIFHRTGYSISFDDIPMVVVNFQCVGFSPMRGVYTMINYFRLDNGVRLYIL